jgi:D-alanine-D-alanine ligase
MSKHVAVLMGGLSAEREVSLTSGVAVKKAVEELRYQVTAIDVNHDIASVLQVVKPDVVFNALHGRFGEDGCIQGILETLEIPYTHSGVMASALAMHKPKAKELFQAHDIPCAMSRVVSKEEVIAGNVMSVPYVIKPLNEGSSVGVYIILEESDFTFDANNWPFGNEVMVEQYIAGREIQVAVLDGKALGAIEIRPKGKFYDYEAKYTDGKAEHLMPAPIEEAQYQEVQKLAEKAFVALHCRGLIRADFILTESGEFAILEVNTQPGMTPLSLAPEIAAHVGMDFNKLVDRQIKSARLGD